MRLNRMQRSFLQWKNQNVILVRIIIGAILVVALGLTAINLVPVYLAKRAEKTPIVSITGSNTKRYKASDTVKPSDFAIIATHADGYQHRLGADQYTLSDEHVQPTGAFTPFTVTLKASPSISCEVEVTAKRDKVMAFECGYPVASDVVAVVYTNGELCFEGSGDCLQFKNYAYPWLSYKHAETYPIRYITFEDAVQPTDMSYWFCNLKYLVGVDDIPSSVQLMIRTFMGCSSLATAPDWSQCSALLDVSEAYKDCVKLTQLKNNGKAPASLKNAQGTFENCQALQTGADLTEAVNLSNITSIYNGCDRLIRVSMPPAPKFMGYAFQGCLNLRIAPAIPSTVENMICAFNGDVSLENAQTIPSKVSDVSSCFQGCKSLRGKIVVEGNPYVYNNFLSGASIATSLDLEGPSRMLDVLANTSNGNSNITVNGRAPDPQMQRRENAIPDEQ